MPAYRPMHASCVNLPLSWMGDIDVFLPGKTRQNVTWQILEQFYWKATVFYTIWQTEPAIIVRTIYNRSMGQRPQPD